MKKEIEIIMIERVIENIDEKIEALRKERHQFMMSLMKLKNEGGTK